VPEPKLGATRGRVRGTSIPGTRVYFKPSMGKVIFRPTNVIRSSKKVTAINEKLIAAPTKPATACKGKPWKEFVACLSKKMKEIVGK
jgi:hypothetical protein